MPRVPFLMLLISNI